ncbi:MULTISPECIES: D-alanyl-D-alanine carboxypeptidase family protein [Caproicibacterium]|uniref:serine-type D-Ala-D-Ala carboxypeptidase n=1 Tax=Caproicibacterium argilliputei TaxID=3030016 RepID=A0AA97DAF8_9FIRM|nr:D-alanyl-D-alanine carboxypeptidase family protein [Caproicibacterium argilliputei]WOC31988.1 D-alanyl-D-alanine carboxypeptidase family protein [Caproicibacterium argilliputei]
MKKRLLSLLLTLSVVLTACLPVYAASGSAASSQPSSTGSATSQSGDSMFKPDFTLNSKAAELVNLDTDTVVFQQNADQKMYPASTTKIMTFIIVMENVKNVDKQTITYTDKEKKQIDGTGSSTAGLKVGEIYSVHQLLYAMMVPSGNDAALLLATYVGGGDISRFVTLMNQKAKALGCTGTHFANPDGLQDENHYTTAHDLALMAKYALTLNYFLEITNTTVYNLKPLNNSSVNHQLTTTNAMIDRGAEGGAYYNPYVKGIKTGHTSQAGRCLVTTAVYGGRTYLCVLMGAPTKSESYGEMIDTTHLYRWVYTNFNLVQIASANQPIWEVPLKYAWNRDSIVLCPEKDVTAVLPEGVSANSVEVTPNVPASVDAPIQKGQVVGTATLTYAKQKLATVRLVANETVDRSELIHSANTARDIVTSPWFLGIAAVILVLVGVYVALALFYNRRKGSLHKVKKYRRF